MTDYTTIKRGTLVRVVKAPAWEYLTVGEVYRADGPATDELGLHSPVDGGGTYVATHLLRDGYVELAEVQA